MWQNTSMCLYKNPLGVTHRLGEVTRQVYRYTGISTVFESIITSFEIRAQYLGQTTKE